MTKFKWQYATYPAIVIGLVSFFIGNTYWRMLIGDIGLILASVGACLLAQQMRNEAKNWLMRYNTLKQIIITTNQNMFNYDLIEGTDFSTNRKFTSEDINKMVYKKEVFRAMVATKIVGSAIDPVIASIVDQADHEQKMKDALKNLYPEK